MRFGKTFASYKLAKEMGWKKILVLTFKPAVQGAWSDDLKSHVDFEGWQFISPDGDLAYEDADKKRPIVCFGSFQDYLGKNKSTGGIKTKNEWVHATHWDCVVLDEYHYGAWRESARELFNAEDGKELYIQFCSHCHGEKGDGNGILMQREKILGVPGYGSDRLPDITPGSAYHVIMHGKNNMGSHASQLSYDERWKIIKYVFQLRAEQNGGAPAAPAADTTATAAL
jgi:cytochrome c553